MKCSFEHWKYDVLSWCSESMAWLRLHHRFRKIFVLISSNQNVSLPSNQNVSLPSNQNVSLPSNQNVSYHPIKMCPYHPIKMCSYHPIKMCPYRNSKENYMSSSENPSTDGRKLCTSHMHRYLDSNRYGYFAGKIQFSLPLFLSSL